MMPEPRPSVVSSATSRDAISAFRAGGRKSQRGIQALRTDERVEELRARTHEFVRDDKTYLIVADEF